MDLSSESKWKQYKEVVAGANVVYCEVVVQLRLRARRSVENADGDESGHVRAENLSRECNPSEVLAEAPTVNNHNQQPDDSSPFDSFRLVDNFDPEVFEQEEKVDDDDISLGSEEEEYPYEEYIAYLHNHIFDLETEVAGPDKEDEEYNNDNVEPLCTDPYCNCTCHKKGPPSPPPPPPPPPPTMEGYYGEGSTQFAMWNNY
ncbi:unnamed protein product [Urochloa humidicola]